MITFLEKCIVWKKCTFSDYNDFTLYINKKHQGDTQKKSKDLLSFFFCMVFDEDSRTVIKIRVIIFWITKSYNWCDFYQLTAAMILLNIRVIIGQG